MHNPALPPSPLRARRPPDRALPPCSRSGAELPRTFLAGFRAASAGMPLESGTFRRFSSKRDTRGRARLSGGQQLTSARGRCGVVSVPCQEERPQCPAERGPGTALPRRASALASARPPQGTRRRTPALCAAVHNNAREPGPTACRDPRPFRKNYIDVWPGRSISPSKGGKLENSPERLVFGECFARKRVFNKTPWTHWGLNPGPPAC